MFEAGGVSTSSSALIRWGGLAAIVAGALLVLAEILSLGFVGRDAEIAVVTGSFTFYAILLAAAAVLLPLGLVSLYARQSEAAGPLGLLGFFIAFAGTTLVGGLWWTGTFIEQAVAATGQAPEFLRVGATPGLYPSVIAFVLGWLLFGVASLQAQVYPRIAVIVLIVGAVIAFIPLPLSTVVLGVAIAWLGYDLFTGMRAMTEETQRPSRVS